MLFIMAFKIFRVGRVGVSRNHLLTEVPVSWTGCFNVCLFLRWEGSEERAAFCWALPFSPEPNLPSFLATPCQRQCHCLALVRPITPVYSSCWAATGGAQDWVFSARPGIVPTHVSPPKKNVQSGKSHSCAVADVSLKNDISSWSCDLSTGLEMSTSSHCSLVFGQIFLLSSVKRMKNAYSRIHQLMKELKEALEYARSHLFSKVPFLFIVLSAIPKHCNSVDIFTRDQLPCGLFSLSQPPLPSPLFPASFGLHLFS